MGKDMLEMNKKKLGKVYLVGGGPGDPQLITVKAVNCIRKADVVIYDCLIDKELLDYSKVDAELIFAGKHNKLHVISQNEINKLILKKSKEGKNVVRLKGGDPYLLARGSEEALYLAKYKIPFEVIPGVSSAMAVPNYAGIPLTQRGISSLVTIITGHEDPSKKNSAINWKALAQQKGTLVILMGVENLSLIIDKLISYGKEKNTPIAVIRWGTTSEQKTVVGTLQNIIDKVKEEKIKPPCVIVMGKVVNLRKKLNWKEEKPLFGKRILVTRSREQASKFSELLKNYGATPMEYPLIKMIPVEGYEDLDSKINNLSKYDWVIFTSVCGVKYFLRRLLNLGKDIRELKGIKIAAIGLKTAQEIVRYGILVDLVPEKFVEEAIISCFKDIDLKNKNILLPRAKKARRILAEELQKRGAFVDEVACYETVKENGNKDELKRMLKKKEIDIITFTSSSTVKNFFRDFKECNQGSLKVACIGPITAKTAQDLKIRVDMISPVHTIEGLAEEIANNYDRNN
ncbi:MAG: uroporphyrinogen-III C-methyltransferase [bacterium]|nr:uroporphyrinogen-III C-methyltransferase [bacterium]